jgi:hypothetical protein
VLVVEKFGTGGWVTIVITGLVIARCLAIRRHYNERREQLRKLDELFAAPAVVPDVANSRRSIRSRRPRCFSPTRTAALPCTRWLHNETALSMQQRLHLKGMQMVILPMRVA